jgi:hypothetical protein
MTSDRRAALVEKVARALCNANCRTECRGCRRDANTAIDLIRAETLEEAAVVFDRYEDNPFTAAVVADHLRRMKGTT